MDLYNMSPVHNIRKSSVLSRSFLLYIYKEIFFTDSSLEVLPPRVARVRGVTRRRG